MPRAAACHLPGLLLNAKGDRVAMNSSVETRYPFLDEEVFAFLAKLDPRWKLHGFREKYLLRQRGRALAAATKSPGAARRMFRAPFDSFHLEQAPPFVDQLLSPESLRQDRLFRSGGGDALAARHYRSCGPAACSARRSRWAWSA